MVAGESLSPWVWAPRRGLGFYFLCLLFFSSARSFFPEVSWEVVDCGPLMPGRRNAQIFCGENHILLFGGKGIERRLNDTWSLVATDLTDSCRWEQLSVPGPSSRSGACTWAHGGGYFLYGGRDDHGDVLGDMWEFSSSQWSKVAVAGQPIPPLFGASCWVFGDRLFLYGGALQNRTTSNSLFQYDSGLWTRLPYAGVGPDAIDDVPVAVSGDRVFFFADMLYSLHLASNTFVRESPRRLDRFDFVAWTVGTAVCSWGGRSSEGVPVSSTAAECFDFERHVWLTHTFPSSPIPRWGMSFCQLEQQDATVCVGGASADASSFLFSDAFRLSLTVPSPPSEAVDHTRALAAAAVVLSVIAIVGVFCVFLLVFFWLPRRRGTVTHA